LSPPNAGPRSTAEPTLTKTSTPRSGGSSRSSTPRAAAAWIWKCGRFRKVDPRSPRGTPRSPEALAESVAAIDGEAPVFEMCLGLLEIRFLLSSNQKGS
jgi:hypothetical protein